MANHAHLRLRHAEVDQGALAVLAVDDDPVEAREQPPPERSAMGRSARQEVVGGEHERRSRTEEPRVDLRRADPLEVEDVRLGKTEARETERMLEGLERDSRPAAAAARRQRVEDLVRDISLG